MDASHNRRNARSNVKQKLQYFSNFVENHVMEPIIKHFTDNDLYTFTCQYYILETYPRAEVEYTFYDRNGQIYPAGFDRLLREQVEYMKDVTITDEEV